MKMDKYKNIPKTEISKISPPPEPQKDPNILVHEFLKEHNLHMKITAIDPSSNGFIGNGFIIEDRPILQVVFERI